MNIRFSSLLVGLTLMWNIGISNGIQSVLADDVKPLKIMCIGDSITMGSGANGGYRLPLEEMLQGAGVSFQFVGRLTTNSKGMTWPGHEGYSGYRLDEVQNGVSHNGKFESGPIAEGLMSLKPDVVLLMVCTNDARQNHDMRGAPKRLDQLIDVIQQADPGVRVVVGTIPPLLYNDDAVRSYNAGAAAVVAKRREAEQKVDLADHYSTLNATLDLVSDRTHPNFGGYDKMARNWFNVLEPNAPQVAFALSTEGANISNGKGISGYKITMRRDATVTDLGIFGGGQALTVARAAGVFDASGKELARTVITPDIAPSGLFVYKKLDAPLKLKSGQSYVFASNNNGFPILTYTDALPDPVYLEYPRFFFDHNIALDFDAGATDATVLRFPGVDEREQNVGIGYLGVNFRFAPQ